MYYRQQLAGILAMLVSLVGVQPASFAGQGKLLGHVVTVGHHHIRQPDPPKQSVPLLNVMNFGATGNGVTDDTAAIQNCFNAAHANGEGVLFPPGAYLHASTVTANSIPIFGVGGASVLIANNPTSTAVILTGIAPSIQNIVLNSGPATSGAFDPTPTHATLLVNAAQGFVVQNCTISQGVGRFGTYLQQSAVGNVTSVTYNGTGNSGAAGETGIFIDSCTNVSVLSNLLLNETTGIDVETLTGVPNSIAIIGNSIITNVASHAGGIFIVGGLDVYSAQNSIQIDTPSSGSPFTVFPDVNIGSEIIITQNVTSGGLIGVAFESAASGNVISQNIFRNCGGSGASVTTDTGTGNVAFLSNQFGECGLTSPGSVLDFVVGQGPNDITVFNNIYAGHANGQTNFMSSTAHLNFVSGNTQTQTALPNTLP